GEICEKYGVIVASDEIHCDFTLPEYPHTVFPVACPALAERTIVCTAPSKTFNLAGLQVSNIWISNEEIRNKILKEIGRSGYSQLNSLGLVAA
ncbi:MAG: aminotransferase class I/II-fold pyridoxal phosphate-dependent enzyme, partial [Lachnospiraceae bacterium]|nr:aminotransferase class I/II-fold pyridoxal phosphate-dependent enzyme [Lachnospiraceae bacterium]